MNIGALDSFYLSYKEKHLAASEILAMRLQDGSASFILQYIRVGTSLHRTRKTELMSMYMMCI